MSDGRNLRVHMLHRSTGLIKDSQNGRDRKGRPSILKCLHQRSSSAQIGEQQIFGHSVGRLRVVDERSSDILYDVRMTREFLQQTYLLNYIFVGVSIRRHQPFQSIFRSRRRVLSDEHKGKTACKGYLNICVKNLNSYIVKYV